MCLEYVHEVCAQCNLVLHSSLNTHSFDVVEVHNFRELV